MQVHKDPQHEIEDQQLYRDIYFFHKRSIKCWYIKDSRHHFVDASEGFISRFLSPGNTFDSGPLEYHVTETAVRNTEIMHSFESQVTEQQKTINLLVGNIFCDVNGVRAFITTLTPCEYKNRGGVMVFLADLAECNEHIDWFSSLLPGALATKKRTGLISLSGQDVLSRVTPGEWETAWMIICGCSIRKIAAYMGVSAKTVENKARNVYAKLGVSNREGLLCAAEEHRWINLIPAKFISSSTIIRL